MTNIKYSSLNKKRNTFILYIIIIGIIFFIVDISSNNYSKCNNKITNYFIILLHHIVNIFAQFGWLSNDKYILSLYLITPIIFLIHWNTYNNKCYLTDFVNKNCNLNDDTLFKDIFYHLKIKKLKNYDTIHKIYLVLVWFIALIKLYSLYA